MSRARQIKPGFFLNEELAEVPPLGRLLFAGMWTVADRDGRLEDRPSKLRAAVLPYDRCDAEKLVALLADKGFILRYAIDGQRYIQIVNFAQHQKPHPKEAPSVIPAPFESESRGNSVTSNGNSGPSNGNSGTSSALPSLSSFPSSPSIPSGDLDLPPTPRKRGKAVDEDFILELIEDFSAVFSADRVREEVGKALNHKTSQKWVNQRAGVRNWLKQAQRFDAERAPTPLRQEWRPVESPPSAPARIVPPASSDDLARWDEVLLMWRPSMSSGSWDTWVEPLRLGCDVLGVVVVARDDTAVEWVTKRQMPQLRAAFSAVGWDAPRIVSGRVQSVEVSA